MIRPLSIDAAGTLTLACDHCPGPSWTVAATGLSLQNASTVILGPCPTCTSTSWHPAHGDGSVRRALQALFIWRLTQAPAVIAASAGAPVWPYAKAALFALIRKQAQGLLGEPTALTPAVNALATALWQVGDVQQGDAVTPT